LIRVKPGGTQGAGRDTVDVFRPRQTNSPNDYPKMLLQWLAIRSAQN